MTKFKPLIWPALIVLFLIGCKEEPIKYQRPSWLAGKVYTQILDQPELSTFAKCIELVGYDSIIDVSGSYTVFAPTNDAWNTYLSQKPYNTIEDIPMSELLRIVKYHIVQNPWSKSQLRSLDIYGWIDTLDLNNNEPKGFKRETILLDDDQKYGISTTGSGRDKRMIIVDTLKTNWSRKVATDARKYVPIFYQEYFSIYDLDISDYQFYFDRSFESSNDLYFAGAKIVSDEISAENGFVYQIDKVVEPLKNAYQFLSDTKGEYQYTDFLDVVNLFPEFEYNDQKTLDQPGADLGLEVDSLFDLTYPELTFDLTKEKTSPPTGTYGLPQNVTIRYHHGLMAPTNDAFQSLISQYIQVPGGWGTLNGAPINIKKIIANTYLAANPIYPTDFTKGFYNGEFDIVKLDEGNIVQKEFGSNTTFIGLKEPVVPRAFSSVTGPVYLKRGYSKVMYAIEQAGLLPALKRPNKNYMFFVESDANTSLDSSLMYNSFSEQFSVILRSGSQFTEFNITTDDLRTLLLNHIAVDQPKGVARKEFIPNLAGNYIVVNNETGEVSGTGKTTDGYKGTRPVPDFPSPISTNADNGTTYDINNWFTFSSPGLYAAISSNYPKFQSLMKKAGLTLDKEFRYNFVSNNEFYTVFVPTEEAINNSGLDTLPKEQLARALMLHFVQGAMIFTDGKEPGGYYETARIDESSTPYSVVYSKININPGIDKIEIIGKTAEQNVVIPESEGTNFFVGVSKGTGQEAFPKLYNNAVIHSIDRVLSINEIDTN